MAARLTANTVAEVRAERASKDATLPMPRPAARACFEARPSASHLSMRGFGAPATGEGAAPSAVLKPRLLLGEEGAHAFGAILCREHAIAHRERGLDRLVLRHVEGEVDRTLAQLQREVRLLGEPLGHVDRGAKRLSLRHDAVDEAPGERGLDRNGLAEEHHLLRPTLADAARDADGAARAGEHAELDLRQRDARPFLGDDEVAAHRKLEAAAEGEPRDRGDRRLREIVDPAP